MFSPRLIVFVALVAVAATYPANDDVPRSISTGLGSDIGEPSLWFGMPHFGNIFGPLTSLFSSFTEIGPKIVVDDDRFRIVVNVKDYKKDDLKVKVKNDFIFVQGSQEAKQDDHDLFASNFFHTYSLPVNASASDVTATLSSDGYLIVDAPLNGNSDKDESVDRVVPIVESGEPYKKNTEDKVENVDKPASTNAPIEIDESSKATTGSPTTVTDFDDDKKEPTTPSNREEVTGNAIPNDELNEVSGANEVKP